MKILLVTPYYKDSFSQKLSMGSAVKQAEQLSAKHKLLVLTTGRNKKSEKVNENLLVKSVNGFLLPDPINYVICFNFFSFFIKNLSIYKPNVVMVSKFMFFTSLVVPVAKVMGYKVVLTTDTFPGINWFPKSKLVGSVMWLYARLVGLPLLWMSNKVILLYKGLEKTSKRYLINSVVINNGVSEQYFKKERTPKDLKKKSGEFWVGFVGRPESVKGIDVFLNTAKKMRKIKEIKFILVGGKDDPYEEKNIKYLGFRSDIAAIYGMFDCLMMPSHAEGLPNALMEAMAKKVPCVASDVGGIPYLINDGVNGFLIKDQRVESYIKKIIRLYESSALRKGIGLQARNTIKEEYDWSKITDQYDDLFSSI